MDRRGIGIFIYFLINLLVKCRMHLLSPYTHSSGRRQNNLFPSLRVWPGTNVPPGAEIVESKSHLFDE